MELFEAIGKVQGKKAIILDACNSGAFIDFLNEIDFWEMAFGRNVIDNYVAIAACPAENTSICSPRFIKNRKVGALTSGLYNSLNFTEKPINLSKIDVKPANDTYRKNIDKLNDLREKDKSKISFEMQRVSDVNFIL